MLCALDNHQLPDSYFISDEVGGGKEIAKLYHRTIGRGSGYIPYKQLTEDYELVAEAVVEPTPIIELPVKKDRSETVFLNKNDLRAMNTFMEIVEVLIEDNAILEGK